MKTFSQKFNVVTILFISLESLEILLHCKKTVSGMFDLVKVIL